MMPHRQLDRTQEPSLLLLHACVHRNQLTRCRPEVNPGQQSIVLAICHPVRAAPKRCNCRNSRLVGHGVVRVVRDVRPGLVGGGGGGRALPAAHVHGGQVLGHLGHLHHSVLGYARMMFCFLLAEHKSGSVNLQRFANGGA